MLQSISHWGQFEIQAPGTENFREQLKPLTGRATAHSVTWPWQVNADNGGDTTIYQKQHFGRDLP